MQNREEEEEERNRSGSRERRHHKKKKKKRSSSHEKRKKKKKRRHSSDEEEEEESEDEWEKRKKARGGGVRMFDLKPEDAAKVGVFVGTVKPSLKESCEIRIFFCVRLDASQHANCFSHNVSGKTSLEEVRQANSYLGGSMQGLDGC